MFVSACVAFVALGAESATSGETRKKSKSIYGARVRSTTTREKSDPRDEKRAKRVVRDRKVAPAAFEESKTNDGESDEDSAETPREPRLASNSALNRHLKPQAENEHPLAPAVRWAKEGLKKLETIGDYSCVLAKRERIDGDLGDHEFLFVKVRHEPFSVYTYFLKPSKVKGQEAIFVSGSNDDKILAHGVGIQAIIGTVSLKPDSKLAMTGNRYPMTEIGIKRLTARLIEVGEHDSQFGECEVTYTPKAVVNKRHCTCIRVIHPIPRDDFLFHKAQIFVDDEYNLPIRYEAYDWPEEEGDEAPLLEEYTYCDLKFDNGFDNLDFDIKNEKYGYRK